MLRIVNLILLLLFSKTALACGGTDHIRPLDKIAESTNALLQKRDFTTLDKLAKQYRSKNSLASDGQPKLMGFYAGVSKSSSNCGGVRESDEQWNDHRQLLSDWSKASPKSSAPKLALASFEAAYGWHARGSEYASKVTEEGWKLFRQRTANAREMLEKLGPEARKDPEWYAEMLSIALAEGWTHDQFDALYSEAVKKFPYYYEFYFTKGNFYSKKWYGSQADYQAFVDESVKATERQLGQSMYARLHWSAWRNSMFKDGQTDWSRMKQGFERILKNFPDDWNRNNFAKFSCMAEDVKVLRQQLDLIGDHVAPAAWGSASYFEACKKYASGTPNCWRREDTKEVFCE